jgi:fermentation-respiration switch protein FrsA (DUF1100 family)
VFLRAALGIALSLLIAQSRAWTFEELLRPPSAGELRLVDDGWARKSWDVAGTRRIGTATVPVGSNRFEAALYSFTLNGSPRCGAVLMPPDPADGRLAGLVDIGDIRWDYPDRDLTNGPYVARILGDRAREFALIVPCARGMGLRVGQLASAAGGDRRDAWEGAAEDAMAFLTVALSETRHIDAARVGVYGYSRGGGVALIAGERDPRIKAVLAFAPPTDFFVAMGRPGVDWASRLNDASRDASLPVDTRESQFLDWFVRGREALPLTELRRRIAAASPLYFAERLPPFQIHQGEADVAVPVRNTTTLRDRVSASAARGVFIYAGFPHMLDDTTAAASARDFLVQALINPP